MKNRFVKITRKEGATSPGSFDMNPIFGEYTYKFALDAHPDSWRFAIEMIKKTG